MPKYELTEDQAKTMVGIIDATNFKGADAVAVVGLKQALSAPIKEEEKPA